MQDRLYMDNFNCSLSKKIIRIVLFALFGACITAGVVVLSAVPGTNRFFAAASGSDFELCTGYSDVAPAIASVQEESQAGKLIIGDSVCRQLFSDLQEQNPAYCIAGTYCTVGLTGQYMLANEFLKSHPDATDIYLVMRPQSLAEQLGSQKTYMYAVAPFVIADAVDALDDATQQEMRSLYWSYGMNRKAASLIVHSPMLAKLYLHKLETEHYAENFTQTGVSAIAVQYLDKLAQLCEEKQVKLHLLAVPLPDNEVSRYAVDNAVEQTKGTSVEALVAELCSTVVYCDETLFLDGQHFDLEQVDAEEVITWIQQENNDLLDLKLGAE
jgi:hypothetical protein